MLHEQISSRRDFGKVRIKVNIPRWNLVRDQEDVATSKACEEHGKPRREKMESMDIWAWTLTCPTYCIKATLIGRLHSHASKIS